MLEVRGLTRGQLLELKQCLLFDRMVENGDWPSYGELANADETITDEAVLRPMRGPYSRRTTSAVRSGCEGGGDKI